MWDDLCRGAIGAIVLVDTARLDDVVLAAGLLRVQGPAVHRRRQPVRRRRSSYPLEEIADALALPADVPIISVDARDRESAKHALVRITEYALQRLTESLSVKAN